MPGGNGAGIERLRLDAATTFVLSNSSRILRENDPDGSPGPRVFIAGCPEGNLAYVRVEIAEPMAAEIISQVGAEPPWFSAETRPACLGRVIELLASVHLVQTVEASLIYRLPQRGPSERAGAFICSDTEEGDALLATLRKHGMPRHLVDAGFVSVRDLWPPWCVVFKDDVIAPIAFAARIAARGAEVGVYTFPEFRGRGLAATVTAKWSALPSLAERTLFYSTSMTNTSSQRVAARLGLHHIGMGLRIN